MEQKLYANSEEILLCKLSVFNMLEGNFSEILNHFSRKNFK